MPPQPRATVVHRHGYEAALRDLADYAAYWRYLEDGEYGSGDAAAIEHVVTLLRQGVKAPPPGLWRLDAEDAACTPTKRGSQA